MHVGLSPTSTPSQPCGTIIRRGRFPWPAAWPRCRPTPDEVNVSVSTPRPGILFSVLLLLAVAAPATRADEPLLTRAEKSDYQETSRHADVVAFCEKLAKQSPLVRLGELGTSHDGRTMPLVILADPPVANAEDAAHGNRLVVLVQGGIHAGEVDGKEAVLMLARDLATAKDRPLLKDLVLVFAPTVNPDGGEKLSKDNRPEQNGPPEVGTRANAQGLDLNRDFVKLESPEVRAMVRFYKKWNPALVIDTHTTDGSFHRYAVTYDGPRHPAADPKLAVLVRDQLLPDVGRRLEKHGGFRSFSYGDFDKDHTRWEPYPALPRYGTQYVGLRQRISILCESYNYSPFKERVLASRDFVLSCLEYAAENRDALSKALADAARPPDLKNKPTVALRHKLVAFDKPVTVLGYVEEQKDGKTVRTDKTQDYSVEHLGRTEATLSVARPYAYLFPATHADVVENVQRHGIEVEELREDVELDVEAYRIDKVTHAEQPYQKHRLTTVEVTPRTEARRLAAGTILVRTAQPLGTLAAFLLEPQSEDGLCTWNFFDAALAEGKDYPVLRLPAEAALTSGRVRPLAEDRTMNRPFTFDAVFGQSPPNLSGNPAVVQAWLDDGEHFLQVKGGRLQKVNATSGRAQPFFDPDKLAQGLATLPALGKGVAQGLTRRPVPEMNPQRTGALFEHDNDLYLCNLDGSKPVRLTKSPGREELVRFSPDGQFVSFVRDGNLCVVDVATQTERALTTDGGGLVTNGKTDWVYGEEVFDRSPEAYWWSPDSKHLVFMRFDDKNVPRFTVVNDTGPKQGVEATPYPRPGEANPVVKLGVVSVAGGDVRWADLTNYTETSSLLVRAGWLPDSQSAYFCIQDRAQTWLDFCTLPVKGGEPTRLFRETTKAWVEEAGAPTFLKDGSFLWLSDRSGWRHLYHFDATGKLLRAVTEGEWEVREVHRVDEKAGWVWFSGTRDGVLGLNLYRVKLDGSGLERLTQGGGDHHVKVSPAGDLFVDSWSDRATPTQVRLYRGTSLARTLDTNPVYLREEYRWGKREFVQVKTPDGFLMEGTLLKPAGFDPAHRYPVWLHTYGGPRMPIVHDGWSGGRLADEVKAQLGFVVFDVDPRSASGKGAVAAWTAYHQLGVQELKDLEAVAAWLAEQPFVDAKRIGLSGHSYGGFLTAFALTHSKQFAAGVAGAPVTDWRNYDSIYTERYMNTPQENPKGYDATSAVKAAADLHGKLLLVHGMIDDNVHPQNTLQLAQALQKADRDFEMMVYPQARHGIGGKHYQRLVFDFMKRALQGE
jgi:dipeptidyl-peptidase 4